MQMLSPDINCMSSCHHAALVTMVTNSYTGLKNVSITRMLLKFIEKQIFFIYFLF